jgi:hypothetical protein
VSPGFVVALFLLLFNDHYLKAKYSNWLTGKLSDFSGLFVLSLFWFAFFPSCKKRILVLIASFFIFWKSPLSQPLIDFINNLGAIHFARVVDYSDLAALIILPLSQRYFQSLKPFASLRVYTYPLLFLSVFAIMGTSVIPPSYLVRFQMQAITPPTSSPHETGLAESVNELIASIAGKYDMQESYSMGNYHYYKDDKLSIETNYDDGTKTIFVSIRALEPEKNRERVDQLQKEISSALSSQFGNLTVAEEPRNYKKDTVTTIQVKTPLKKFPLPSWCKTNGLDNKEIMKAFESTETYLQSYFIISAPSYDSRDGFCYSKESCEKSLCRSYEIGRVIGAGRADRSTSVRIYFSAGWSGATLYIDFIRHTIDGSLEVDKLIADLQQVLVSSLDKGTLVEVSNKSNSEIFGAGQD